MALNIQSPPYIYPTQPSFSLEQAEQKHLFSEIDDLAHEGHQPIIREIDSVSELFSKALKKFQRIADLDILSNLWYCLRAQRCLASKRLLGAITKTTELLDTSVEGQLIKYHYQRQNVETFHKYFAQFPRRLYLAQIAKLYKKEKLARKEEMNFRKKRELKGGNSWNVTRRSISDTFVECLLPQVYREGDTRRKTKKRFENWLSLGRTCAKLVESFGLGVLLLLPQDIRDDNLRELTLPQEDALIRYLEYSKPSFRSDIENLSIVLSSLIENQHLPERMLMLEVLSERQVRSKEFPMQSLKDLLKYSNGVDYSPSSADTGTLESSQLYNSASSDILEDWNNGAGNSVNLSSPIRSDAHTSTVFSYNFTEYLN